ncbi:MAG: MFS transporter [Thermoanaerobaculia bacterium]|nr:MFS transporter [Thermoanaerobaculia bacterium]
MTRPDALAWMFYDFGNSAFTTLVVTFIFSAWFTQGIALDPDRGTVLWSHAVNASSLLVALTAPFLGAIADVSGHRRRLLFWMTLLCVVTTGSLYFPVKGDVAFALLAFVIANYAFEAAIVFYNAYLPEVSTPRTIGRVSGAGQALGYLGGLLCLVIALAMIRVWLPDDRGLNVRATNLLVAAWYAIFAIPLLLVRPGNAAGGLVRTSAAMKGAARQLIDTARHLKRYRQAARLIVARLVYNDGLVTVFAFAAIYAAAVFGMSTSDLIVMGISINVAAAVGSWAFGFVDDRIGGKRTIAITLLVLIVVTAVGATTENRTVFWIAALLLGSMVGPNQAASRSLLGSFTPPSKRGEWFGFFAFSGRLASVAGPLVYGLVISAAGSQRVAMGSIIAFFVIGLLILMTIDESEGKEMAETGGM